MVLLEAASKPLYKISLCGADSQRNRKRNPKRRELREEHGHNVYTNLRKHIMPRTYIASRSRSISRSTTYHGRSHSRSKPFSSRRHRPSLLMTTFLSILTSIGIGAYLGSRSPRIERRSRSRSRYEQQQQSSHWAEAEREQWLSEEREHRELNRCAEREDRIARDERWQERRYRNIDESFDENGEEDEGYEEHGEYIDDEDEDLIVAQYFKYDGTPAQPEDKVCIVQRAPLREWKRIMEKKGDENARYEM